MTSIKVDVEVDGPEPEIYTMVSVRAVIVEPGLFRKLNREMPPISGNRIPQVLDVSGFY